MINLKHDNRCLGRVSNGAKPKYKSNALPVKLPFSVLVLEISSLNKKANNSFYSELIYLRHMQTFIRTNVEV
jgi:hypothetical protein